MAIDARDEQFWNAQYPIDVMSEGMATEVREVQSENVKLSIVVTP
jgi:hypothetical protein